MNMTENETQKPEDVLREILNGLQSEDAVERMSAITQLKSFNYGSEAIRNELEKLALNDSDENIRREALAALDLPTQRSVRGRFNKIDRDNRRVLLQEITEWEKLGILEKQKADVLRRRYNFDFTPPPAVPIAPVQSAIAAPEEITPPEPASPRPTLLQNLLSETNIKISLYLGAFFVVASAAILGAFVDIFRIPLLIIGTVIFGVLSVAIRKRLPQPSFALFIVFSFFLPITANVIENTLELSSPLSAAYWIFVSLFMAFVWGGGTWLYTSHLFSVTAFVSSVIAFYRVGDLFHAESEFFAAMLGIASLAGLASVWVLKKWKDAKFALPLFLTAQLLQIGILVTYQAGFMFEFGNVFTSPLWNLLLVFTWGFAFLFYIFSNLLFPFFLFPWLAAVTLIPIPWLVGSAFEVNTLANMIIFIFWGLSVAAASEAAHRLELTRKYSLPILLASIPVLINAAASGFVHSNSYGFAAALSAAIIYGVLHFIRPRGWLWAIALVNFIVAYFAFFKLPFADDLNIHLGYQLLGLSLLFLLPGLFSKNDLKTHADWRLPPLIYGVFFTLAATIVLIADGSQQQAAIGFAFFTIFFILYTAAQRKAVYGYIPAAFLALTVFFALDHFKPDTWLPALTGLAVLYFVVGVALRSKETWAVMLRYSGLALGTFISFAALFTLKENGGAYVLVIGLLFAAEMYLSRNGWFEIGVPVMFSVGAFLILRDLDIDEIPLHLLAYSLVWLGADLVSHVAFKEPRPLKWIVRGVGAFLAVINYGFLFFDGNSNTAAFGFGIYTLLFLTLSLVYRHPILFYTFTLTLPLFVAFFFRAFDITKWDHPVIFVAMAYYAVGFFLRLTKRASGWDETLLFSGLGIGVIVSIAAPIIGGVDAAIPVAFAATLWAVEAFWRKNVWLAFPANGLYLLAYFVILYELNADQPQLYSMGAALLGLLQHYLLTRGESKTGAFIMGMVSQLVLLGTTYIQMVSNGSQGLIYFVVLFLQAMAVLAYGIFIRSRSLTFTPIFFLVISVMSVIYILVYDLLDAITSILMVGCTGILLLGLGIAAVLMRERITKLGERLSEWKA
jgi:hypothetical protein